MIHEMQPTSQELRDNPTLDEIIAITIRPNCTICSNKKHGHVYIGTRFDVQYKVGHTIYYGFVENLELFEQLMRHMVENKNIYNDMLIKEYSACKVTDTLLKVSVRYEDDCCDVFEFEIYNEDKPRCINNKDADTLKWLEARALLYQCGERRYQYAQGGWSKIQPYAM